MRPRPIRRLGPVDRTGHEALRQELADDYPDDDDIARELGAGFNNLGLLEAREGRADDAIRSLRRAVELRKRLVDRRPGVPLYRSNLSDSLFNLANRLRDSDRAREALAVSKEGLAIRSKLVAEHPDVLMYRESLALGYFNQSLYYRSTLSPALSMDCLRRSAIDPGGPGREEPRRGRLSRQPGQHRVHDGHAEGRRREMGRRPRPLPTVQVHPGGGRPAPSRLRRASLRPRLVLREDWEVAARRGASEGGPRILRGGFRRVRGGREARPEEPGPPGRIFRGARRARDLPLPGRSIGRCILRVSASDRAEKGFALRREADRERPPTHGDAPPPPGRQPEGDRQGGRGRGDGPRAFAMGLGRPGRPLRRGQRAGPLRPAAPGSA